MISLRDLLDGLLAKAAVLAAGVALAVILTLSVALVLTRAQRDAARAELRRIHDQAVALEAAVREASERAARERERTDALLEELRTITPATSPAEAARRAREVARRLQ